MSGVTVIAVITPKAEHKAVALEGFSRLAAEVEKNEPDCTVFRIHETEEGEFVIFQQYKTKAAWEAHQNSEYSKKARASSEAAGGLAKEPSVKVFSSTGTAGFGPR
ncbi:hypothetical protein MPH_01747 [Macrophomina phaseolina MS6]|uniref:ABM domain-containing protein n=1 Tax=Macrophomina phaseolina (strain MS6) TaxID=1126212 RepID=K2S1H2_MACPH|nr:hypothetical protein MPH_01747 [Macrophomina phaseolina MS6]